MLKSIFIVVSLYFFFVSVSHRREPDVPEVTRRLPVVRTQLRVMKLPETPKSDPLLSKHQTKRPLIAICAATHSKTNWRNVASTTLQKLLIPSIRSSVSAKDRSKYDFRLYLAADDDDSFWLRNKNKLTAPDWLPISLGFYKTPKHKIPFNPMMRAAYNDGAEYMVRINDDSEFVTPNWVSKGVSKLASYNPPNVGMVGPNCLEGNRKIMTHDMVHRTHLDIFEHYYPDVFSAWWIDDWISKVYGPKRSTKIMDWRVKHHVHKYGTRYKVQRGEAKFLKGELKKGAVKIKEWLLGSMKTPATRTKAAVYQIHVLTMNRPKSLQRLLDSLEKADYAGDPVELHIHIDKSIGNRGCIKVAESFDFSYGDVTIDVAEQNNGLRDAWFRAWRPQDNERAIIFEDDIEVSSQWYLWLKKAWDAYGERDDLAGISLQRQTLVPQTPQKQMEIVNDHKPFLYRLVGSIGFSPHWKQWRAFLNWVDSVDTATVDVKTPGLVTSKWFDILDRRHMWTQYFIWFCKRHGLFTLYMNLPDKKTMASHMREKGEHFARTEGRDFALATQVEMNLPTVLVKYGWDGRMVVSDTYKTDEIFDGKKFIYDHSDRFRKLTDAQKANSLEGHTFNQDTSGKFTRMPQLEAYANLVWKNRKSIRTVCETGFNGGHSTVLWASIIPNVEIIAFDMCIGTRCDVGKSFFNKLFPDASLTIVRGDSTKSVPDYAKSHSEKCDFISVDGGHFNDVPRLDIENMVKLARGSAIIVIDDVDKDSKLEYLKTVGIAWFNAVNNNLVTSEKCEECYAKDAERRTTCTFCNGRVVRTDAPPRTSPVLVTDGSEYGGWTYDSSQLTSDSVVYSVGLGEDTSWDEGIMKRFGLNVWGFDPTPKSIEYVRKNNKLGQNFHFTAEALGIEKGVRTFTKPKNPNHVSMREGRHDGLGETVEVHTNTLQNWMDKFGHSHIDILKIDIEGSEYDVLEDWIKKEWFPMDQLLVEFHQRFFENTDRHFKVIAGLKESGFKIIHDKNNNGQEIAFRKLQKKATDTPSTIGQIPIVLTAINSQINRVAKATIPFLCTNNERVVLLTNVQQRSIQKKECLEVVDISAIYQLVKFEKPWPKKAPERQKVFFDRWYVLRNWMQKSGRNRVFVMDSDAIMTQSVTDIVKNNWNLFRQHELWIYYNPPRSSFPFAFLSLDALEDITQFWNRALASDVWTPEFVKSTSPNDMVLLGHYSHSAVGKPYPCWGYGAEHKDGSCDDSIDYGHKKVLDRLVEKNVVAKYAPGTLSLNRKGKPVFDVGVVDNNYRHDPIKRYEMKNGQKQLRFVNGTPQLKLKTGGWTSLWGYILEDSLEACVNSHLQLIKSKATCVCSEFCCKSCPTTHEPPLPSLTVWSLWKDNFDVFLRMHVKFYSDFWKADRLFLNIGCEGEVKSASAVHDVIVSQCGDKKKRIQVKYMHNALLDRYTCKSGTSIDVLYYKSKYHKLQSQPQVWDKQKSELMALYEKSFDLTQRKMHVDHDEFFVPAAKNINSIRRSTGFNYHRVDIKPVKGKRNWSNTLQWVDQPYFYRLRSQGGTYPSDVWDGNEPLTTLHKISHSGPHKEHDNLRKCAKQGSDAYAHCIPNYNIMYHISVHDEDYFLNQKHFDQTTANANKIAVSEFPKEYLNPEKDFVVFNDEFMRQFIPKIRHEKESPWDGGTKTDFVQQAKMIQSLHGFVNIQLLNTGYVDMTKSWICNVRSFPGVLEKTLFITTDQIAHDKLLQFDSSLNVVLELYETPKDLTYGQYAYYDFMLFRTRLLIRLLKEKITVWLTESDAVWLNDPTDIVLNTHGDMVTMSDGKPPAKILQGGFQLLRPTNPTVSVWTKLLAMFQRKMSATKKGTNMNDSGSEQLMLNGLIRKEPNLDMQWLDWHYFAPGLYYRSHQKWVRPYVILNNWIKGNKAKIARAKKWKHWFLDGNGQCLT
jgi:FkbM family methyltransferase